MRHSDGSGGADRMTSLLPSLNIPVLLIAGARDLIIPTGVMKILHEKIAGSEFHILPRSAHLSNLEDTDEFNRILIEFLKKHWHV